LLSVPAGGGGAASSVTGGQDPVYYAALVSWGGWCKVTVSFLFLPLNPLHFRRRSRVPAGWRDHPLIILVHPRIRRIECSCLLSSACNWLVT